MALTRNVNITTHLNIEFSKYYRENRHGTKIIKVVIRAERNQDTENNQCSLEAKVKVPRQEGKICWDLPDSCPQWVRREVTCVYDYTQFERLLSTMEKRKACK